jgi:predicted nucleotidyltransferase
MTLVAEYLDARRDEDVARLRRAVALRAMVATGMTQSQIANELGVSQSAVSQQLRNAPDLTAVEPVTLIRAAGPVLRDVIEQHGFSRPAVFGSVARGTARPASDIDLLVRAPKGASSFDLVRLAMVLEEILGRHVDLVEYGALKPGVDDDVRRDAVNL